MAGRPKGSRKIGGRKAGVPNKTTAQVKAALLAAFEGIGGVESLSRWAKKEPAEFYKLWAKLLPSEMKADIQVSGNIGVSLQEVMNELDRRERSKA